MHGYLNMTLKSNNIDSCRCFYIILILLFMLMNHSDQGSNRITVSENAELRTGPNAAYPVIYQVEKVIRLLD